MPLENELKVFAKRLRNHKRRLRKYRFFILSIELSLYLFGLRKTIKILKFFTKQNNKPDITGDAVFLDNLVTIFNQIKEHKLLKGKCLSQSLAMQFILKRKAIETNLIIGGNIKGGGLFGHAWLEKDGTIINDHPFVVAQYQVFINGDVFSNFQLK